MKFNVEKELYDECVEFDTIYCAYRNLRLLFLKQLYLIEYPVAVFVRKLLC